ncbi:hypothetical protein D3C72_2597360 [compost metagenome]
MNFYAEALVAEVLAMEEELEKGMHTEEVIYMLKRISHEIEGMFGQRSTTAALSGTQ